MTHAYKFFWDCGRNGNLHGVFIASEEEIKNAIGKEVYFGEVLGKHSEIHGTLDEGDLKILTSDPSEISLIKRLGLTSGFNPLNYMEEDE